jgi:ubiquinone/menaquinone biosynthesis C-methylase UbiE
MRISKGSPVSVGGERPSTSSFDALAPSFDRHRALPVEVAETVRGAILAALTGPAGARPRVLDLGAGSGRIGWPFVSAGDDYVGVDLSGGMLRVFAGRLDTGTRAELVQADGCALPFANATFDAVLLMHVLGDLPGWRRLLDEARRVLHSGGALILGRAVTPADGVDARMKQHLATLLGDTPTRPKRQNTREDAGRYLAAIASATTQLVAASWSAGRSPRMFLDRHAGGARFSLLPRAAREEALRALAVWAETRFGDLDAPIPETHRFEMRLFRFQRG